LEKEYYLFFKLVKDRAIWLYVFINKKIPFQLLSAAKGKGWKYWQEYFNNVYLSAPS
jgi:hypothetical protein